MHVLEKLWAVSRAALYTCRSPADAFTLTLVNRAFRECMVEYRVGHTIFSERLFNTARLDAWEPRDVQRVWVQAARLLDRRDTPGPASDALDADLLASLEAALLEENVRAGTEYDEKVATFADGDVGCGIHRNTTEIRPISGVAYHRWLQQLGILRVAFRAAEDQIGWFASEGLWHPREIVRPRVATETEAMGFALTRSAGGHLESFLFINVQKVNVRYIDWRFIPSTCQRIDCNNSACVGRACFESPFVDLAVSVGKRLRACSFSTTGLSVDFKLTDLEKFPNLEHVYLYNNNLHTTSEVFDFERLRAASACPNLHTLELYANKRLKAELRGLASFPLDVGGTGFEPEASSKDLFDTASDVD